MATTKKNISYNVLNAIPLAEKIERKGQLDGVAKGEYITKKGHPCFNYLDIWATEKFGSPQYRNASVKWEFNDTSTLNVNHIDSILN